MLIYILISWSLVKKLTSASIIGAFRWIKPSVSASTIKWKHKIQSSCSTLKYPSVLVTVYYLHLNCIGSHPWNIENIHTLLPPPPSLTEGFFVFGLNTNPCTLINTSDNVNLTTKQRWSIHLFIKTSVTRTWAGRHLSNSSLNLLNEKVCVKFRSTYGN